MGQTRLFDNSQRSTLNVKAPGYDPATDIAEGIVESIDLYPTLCELGGIPLPQGLDGTSLVPMLSDASAQVKQAAHWFWHNGTTVRTKRY